MHFLNLWVIPSSEWIISKLNLVCRVSANDLGNQGSITGWVLPKTQKMVLDTSLINPQHYIYCQFLYTELFFT